MALKRNTSVARAKTPAKSARASKPTSAGSKPAQASEPARRTGKAAGKRATAARTSKPSEPAKVKRKSAGGVAPMFQKVAFTMFSVEDPQRARAFYEDVLGLTRGLASPDGTWTEYDLPAGGCLALFRHPDPKQARTPGGASVALEVADLDTLNERLKAAGVVYEGGVIHGPNCRMSNIRDSEGNSLILHQLNRS